MNFTSVQSDGVRRYSSMDDVIDGYKQKSLMRTPTLMHESGGLRVVSSLRSIPGYRASNIAAAEDVDVEVVEADTLKKRAMYGTSSGSSDVSDSQPSTSGNAPSTSSGRNRESDPESDRYVTAPRAYADARPEADAAYGGTSTFGRQGPHVVSVTLEPHDARISQASDSNTPHGYDNAAYDM